MKLYLRPSSIQYRAVGASVAPLWLGSGLLTAYCISLPSNQMYAESLCWFMSISSSSDHSCNTEAQNSTANAVIKLFVGMVESFARALWSQYYLLALAAPLVRSFLQPCNKLKGSRNRHAVGVLANKCSHLFDQPGSEHRCGREFSFASLEL